jgi:hypothetical protein
VNPCPRAYSDLIASRKRGAGARLADAAPVNDIPMTSEAWDGVRMERTGIEPVTSGLQSRRSPS